jgi:aspartate 1-decarboxylase
MNRTMLKSKIHRATITGADLTYEGSISVDPVLIEAACLLPYERVEIYNCNNGARLATYVIPGKPGEMCINGAAARLAQPGDIVIIASYIELENEKCFDHRPVVVHVDSKNKEVKYTDISPLRIQIDQEKIWPEREDFVAQS